MHITLYFECLYSGLNAIVRKEAIITPRAHARARGYVIGRGVYYIYIVIYLQNFFLSFKILSEVYFNTDRLLIEFNGLWYSLAARQVFVAIANPDIGDS